MVSSPFWTQCNTRRRQQLFRVSFPGNPTVTMLKLSQRHAMHVMKHHVRRLSTSWQTKTHCDRRAKYRLSVQQLRFTWSNQRGAVQALLSPSMKAFVNTTCTAEIWGMRLPRTSVELVSVIWGCWCRRIFLLNYNPAQPAVTALRKISASSNIIIGEIWLLHWSDQVGRMNQSVMFYHRTTSINQDPACCDNDEIN